MKKLVALLSSLMLAGISAAAVIAVSPTASGVVAGDLARDGAATPHQLALVVENLGGLASTATAEIRVRTNSPQGSWSTWRPMLRVQTNTGSTPPWAGGIEDVFAWTFFGLSPDTAYDVQLRKTLGATVDDDEISTFTTRALPSETLPTITTSIAAALTAAQRQTEINDAATDAGANPIHIRFLDGTHDMSGITWPASVSGSLGTESYVTGETRAGTILTDTDQLAIIDLDADISNVVFQDFSLVGSGTNGGGFETSTCFFSPDADEATNITIRRTTCTDVNRGIYFYGLANGAPEHSGALVYDNTIVGNNDWSNSPTAYFTTNAAWDDYGIIMAGHGHAVFNNTISSFGDMFSTTSGSGGSRSEQDRSQHFYWNDVDEALDDVIELDDGYRNVSLYQNRMRNIVNAGSADPWYGGPFIMWGNIAINVAEVRMFKWNTDSAGLFIYNNSFAMTNKIYRSSLGQNNDFMWYQPTSGTTNGHTDIGIANNVFVMQNSAPDNNVLLNDATWYGDRDIHHNSWFPDQDFDSNGISAVSLSAFQALQPAADGLFENFEQFENDTITVAQPWATTLSLGADYTTETLTDYSWADFAASHSSITNTGRAIPNITDNLTETYDGVAPDRGANISGLTMPVFGDRTTFPSWYPASAGTVVAITPATTAGAAARADGANSYGGTDPDDIFDVWSGGALATIDGQEYLLAYGGGHGDSSYDGILQFGPLTGAGSDTPDWSVFLSGCGAANVQFAATCSNGRQTSIHSYDNMEAVGSTLYVLSTSEHYASANSTSDAYSFTSSGQTSITNGPFGTGGSTRLTTAYSPADNRIYVVVGSSTSDILRYYDIAGNSWGSIAGSETLGLFSSMAIDTTRNALLYVRANGASSGSANSTIYYDIDAATRQSGKNAPANFFAGVLYDAGTDEFVTVIDNSLTVQRLDASALSTSGGNPSWTNRVFTGATPAAGPTCTGCGAYGRFQYVPALKGYIYAPSLEADVYFYRSQEIDFLWVVVTGRRRRVAAANDEIYDVRMAA